MKDFNHQPHNHERQNERRSFNSHGRADSLQLEYQNALAHQHFNTSSWQLDSRRPCSDVAPLPVVQISTDRLYPGARRPVEIPSQDSIHDITVHGRNGHTDIVSGIRPLPGESLDHLVKRLHPNLGAEQLAHEVRQILKYNRDYGNNLGDSTHLDPNRAVFLTSVKYADAQGRVNRIEGPSGRVTEMNYGTDGQISGYRIMSSSGAIEEEASKNANAQWMVSRNGQNESLKSVLLDCNGDLISTDVAGNQLAHLTNGTDFATTYDAGRAIKTETSRHGEHISEYLYEPDGNGTKVYVIDHSDPSRKVLLNPQDSVETFARLAAAMGLAQRPEAPVVHRSSYDLPTENSFGSSIVRAGMSLLGQPVTNFDSSIPTRVGCARMVSQALVGAGFDGQIIDANVDNLEAKLKSHGFVAVSESDMKAGDVIIATGPGADDGHTGIYEGNGLALNNSSSRGVFSSSSYEGTFGGFSRRVGYRYNV